MVGLEGACKMPRGVNESWTGTGPVEYTAEFLQEVGRLQQKLREEIEQRRNANAAEAKSGSPTVTAKGESGAKSKCVVCDRRQLLFPWLMLAPKCHRCSNQPAHTDLRSRRSSSIMSILVLLRANSDCFCARRGRPLISRVDKQLLGRV